MGTRISWYLAIGALVALCIYGWLNDAAQPSEAHSLDRGESRETTDSARDQQERARAQRAAETAQLAEYYRREQREAEQRIRSLERDLSTAIEAANADPRNADLQAEAMNIARELESARALLIHRRTGRPLFNEPELGGSCVFPLPSQLEARTQRGRGKGSAD